MSKQPLLCSTLLLLFTVVISQSSYIATYNSIEGNFPSQSVIYRYTLSSNMGVASHNTFALTIDTGTLNDTQANNNAWFGGYHISTMNNWFGELYLYFNISQLDVDPNAVSEILVHYNTSYCAGDVNYAGGGFYIYNFQSNAWTVIYEKLDGWRCGTYVANKVHVASNGEVRFKITTYLVRCIEYGYTQEQCTHYARCEWLSIDAKTENQTKTLDTHYWASPDTNTTYRLDFEYDFPIRKIIETSQYGYWTIYNGSEKIQRKYKAPISIHNPNSEILTDFQIKLFTDYNNYMISDFSDLRFAYYNTTTKHYELVPAWAEKVHTSKNATIWVKVPTLSANTIYTAVNTTYFVFFGNVTEEGSYWDGGKVFMLFDDFEGTSLDAYKWEAVGEGLQISSTYAYNGSNSAMRNDNYRTYGTIKHNFSSLLTGIITIWFYDDGTPKTEAALTGNGATSFFTGRHDYSVANYYFYRIGGSYSSTGIHFSTAWHNATFVYTGNEAKLYFDNTLVAVTATVAQFNFIELGDNWSGTEYPYGDAWFDLVTVRKYAPYEPATSIILTDEMANSEDCWVLLKRDGSILSGWTVKALENSTDLFLEKQTTNSTGYANFHSINDKFVYFEIVNPWNTTKAKSQAYSANLHLNVSLITYGGEEIACTYPAGHEILNITCVYDGAALGTENYTVTEYNATHRQVRIKNEVMNSKGEQFRLYTTSKNAIHEIKAYCDGNETNHISPRREATLNVTIKDPHGNPIVGQTVSIGCNGSSLGSTPSHFDGVASINFTTPSEYSILYICANTSGNYCGILTGELTVPPIDIILSPNGTRVDVNEVIQVLGAVKYTTDGTNVPSGIITINGTSYQVLNGAFSFTERKDVVGKQTYTVTNLSGTSVCTLTNYPSIDLVWDRVKITLNAGSSRVNVNSTHGISYSGIYEYDSAAWNGVLTLNDTNTSYSSIGKRGFNVTAITDPTYGLKTFTANSVSITWDALLIERYDVDVSNQKMILKLVYASDGAPVSSGVIEYAGRYFVTSNDGWATVNLRELSQIPFNSPANPVKDYMYGITCVANAPSIPIQVNRTAYKDFFIKSCYPAKKITYTNQRLSFDIDVPTGESCDVDLYSPTEPKLFLVNGHKALYNYSFRKVNFSITGSRIDIYYGVVKVKEFSYDEAAKKLILKVYPNYIESETIQWNVTTYIKDAYTGAQVKQQSIILDLPDCNVRTLSFDESDLPKPAWYNTSVIIYDPSTLVEIQRHNELKFDPPAETESSPTLLTSITSYLSNIWQQTITATTIVETAYMKKVRKRKGINQILVTMLITITAVIGIALVWQYLPPLANSIFTGRVVAQARIMGKTAVVVVKNNERKPIDVFRIDIEGIEIPTSRSLIDPGKSLAFVGKVCGAEKGRLYAISIGYMMDDNECVIVTKALCE